MRVLVGSLVLLASLMPFPAFAAPSDRDVQVARVLELTNAERQKAGIPPLRISTQLSEAAQTYSNVLANTDCFAHTCGPVPDMADRMGQAGYTGWSAIAENIAAGYPSPEAVVAGWMGSSGHRENLLNPSYSEIGIGLAAGGGRFGTFWTQDFGKRSGGEIVLPAPSIDLEPAPPADEEEAPAE